MEQKEQNTTEQKFELIKKQKGIYESLLTKYEIGDEKLLKWLETTDFYLAPANPSNNLACFKDI